MSWFFGKKKHHRDSPPDTPEEEPAPPDEGFIFVERRNEPGANGNENASNLYPSLSNVTPYPPMPLSFVKENIQESNTNYLSNIPFKLCKELESNMNDDLSIDRLRLDEIVSFIKRINAEDYEYEFSAERTVISEMDSQTEE